MRLWMVWSGEIVQEVLKKERAWSLIFADHGNSEELINLRDREIDKEHSTNPVSFHIIGKALKGRRDCPAMCQKKKSGTFAAGGILAVWLPTISWSLNLRT